jgi:FtsZ-binding cell division protein ZapB
MDKDPVKPGIPDAALSGKSSSRVGLFVIAGILFTALVAVAVMYYLQRESMIEMELVLTEEKDSLANELVLLMHGYDTLKTNNDTLNAQLMVEQEKIKRLLSINASNVQLIRTYKKEISTMRDIMKSYIVQIDSLNTRNKILVAENIQIREEISRVEKSNVELSKVREELTTKVVIASVIQAKDIISSPLNKKRKETDRVDRMVNLMVCFTLRENPIADAGDKTVFIRVIRPDGLLVTISPDNIFTFKDETLIFTESRTVEYLNQDVELCIYVDNNGDFIEGTYSLELYLEGEKIGVGSFMLR